MCLKQWNNCLKFTLYENFEEFIKTACILNLQCYTLKRKQNTLEIHWTGTSNLCRILKRGSGWCELLKETRDEIIPEKRAEITVSEPELSHVTGEMHCWMQKVPESYPESRWYHGLRSSFYTEGRFLFSSKI